VRRKLTTYDFVRIKNISEFCMVSTCTVRRWIKDNDLHALKLPGGHFRVTVKDLTAFLKKHKIPFDNSLIQASK
jgi:excisionase family DNA binding protein